MHPSEPRRPSRTARRRPARARGLAASALAALAVSATGAAAQPGPVAVRVAAFNIEDLRTSELLDPPSERALRAAEVIQRIRPTIILINEIAYDEEEAPDFPGGDPGRNGRRLAELLARPIADGVRPLDMAAFTRPSNTGRASGFDLDRSGRVEMTIPEIVRPGPEGGPAPAAENGQAYGGDAWGYGTFPGQYGMALLVDRRLDILEERARTFRLFPWSKMPGNLMPAVPEGDAPQAEADERTGRLENAEAGGTPWYEGEAGELFRLSSKSHWDVPIALPNGAILHILASHPTPPAFDGPEERNKRRNHDEIRFWADYVEDAAYIIDDNGFAGGLRRSAAFVIAGDLNADPDEGSAFNNPINSLLCASDRIDCGFVPVADLGIPELDPDDTAGFRLRVDYVLPSAGLRVLDGGVWRHAVAGGPFPSDHYPVWIDLAVPADAR